MWSSQLRLPPWLLAIYLPYFATSLPYSPTTILFPTAPNNSLAFIFQPSATIPQFELVALDLRSSVATNSFSTTPVSTSLPFSIDDNGSSFTPLIDSKGDIYVYTGRCGDSVSGGRLWVFTSGQDSLNGIWKGQDISPSGIDTTTNIAGPSYLASGIAFSSAVNGSSEVYIFGGMCPNSTTLTAQDWQASANYSNSMLILQPPISSASSAQFTLSTLSTRGPPIAEAGFTITSLKPAYFNSSDSELIQQQNFVLIGGHTKEAFINMSQVALFSLPEQTWAFLPVDEPPASAKTDLAVRNPPAIDPRSGHTAVLTVDGKQIVLFGGWVGDVMTPANPQLAILDIGQGYGGNGDWQWTIPHQQGVGPSTNEGLYGHGASMLPGGVMMITGGFVISMNRNPVAKRSENPNTSTYFFNMTSGSWISTYTNPIAIVSPSSSAHFSSDSTASVTKVGLGAGLGFGLLAVLGIAIVYFCYRRRTKRRRQAREKELQNLALSAQRFQSSGLGLAGIDGRGAAAEWMGGQGDISRDAYPWAFGHDFGGEPGEVPGWRRARDAEAERTGLLVEIPSPTRGLRRSLHSRGANQLPTWYDEGRRSRVSGNIHPIDERDEYEEATVSGDFSLQPEMTQRNGAKILGTVPVLDPFTDPLSNNHLGGSRTPSPQSPARERERELQSWVNDWSAADGLMHQNAGRVSPDKTDRTSSTLSDRSTVSAISIQQSVGSLSRSISQRSAALFSLNPFTSSANSPNHPPTSDTPAGQRPSYGRSKSLTLDTERARPNTSDAFVTVAPSFAQLQSEGEVLLGSNAMRGSTSPTRFQSRARGWMGSMRRAFTNSAERIPSTPPGSGERSAASSPTKLHSPASGIPQRAASTGTMLWRTRQGARDWDVDDARNSRGAGTLTAASAPDDEEWDVESAVERRVVQVMFTVPKEKLRIVNGGPEGDSESVVSVKRETEREKGDAGTSAWTQNTDTQG